MDGNYFSLLHIYCPHDNDKRLSLSSRFSSFAIRIARVFVLFSSVSDCREGATLDIRGTDIALRKISRLGEFHLVRTNGNKASQPTDWLFYYRFNRYRIHLDDRGASSRSSSSTPVGGSIRLKRFESLISRPHC